MKKYSEHNEDEFVEAYFKDVADGFFLDIGANDGIACSNTRILFDKGWSGIAVEACLGTYVELVKNYQKQERVRVVHAAVTDKRGMVPFWENPAVPCFGLNSADRRYAESFNATPLFLQVTTPSLRLQDLGLPRDIDFLSVDTEGGDLLILSTLDETIRPRLICAEMDKFDYGDKIRELLKSKGYRHLLDVETNGFFERL